jgi:hypothetical protein
LQAIASLGAIEIEYIGRRQQENAISLLALSLGIVLSGSGNVKALSRLRKLYGRISGDVHYGNHMSIATAMGFVCLGNGRFAFDNNPRDVAFLIASCYPQFPSNPSDDRGHLQALRHLYVLSAHQRSLTAIDIQAKTACHVPLEVSLRSGYSEYDAFLSGVTPCMLPPARCIESIRVASPRYEAFTISSDNNIRLLEQVLARGTLLVQLRPAQTPYGDDQASLEALLQGDLQRAERSSSEVRAATRLHKSVTASQIQSISAGKRSASASDIVPVSLQLPWPEFNAQSLLAQLQFNSPGLSTILERIYSQACSFRHCTSDEDISLEAAQTAVRNVHDMRSLQHALQSSSEVQDVAQTNLKTFIQSIMLELSLVVDTAFRHLLKIDGVAQHALAFIESSQQPDAMLRIARQYPRSVVLLTLCGIFQVPPELKAIVDQLPVPCSLPRALVALNIIPVTTTLDRVRLAHLFTEARSHAVQDSV